MNLTQLSVVRVMVTLALGKLDRNAVDGEDWSKNGDIYQVGQTLEAICINNAASVIANIWKRGKLRKVLEDMILPPY